MNLKKINIDLCPHARGGHVPQLQLSWFGGNSTGGRKGTSRKVMLLLEEGNALF